MTEKQYLRLITIALVGIFIIMLARYLTDRLGYERGFIQGERYGVGTEGYRMMMKIYRKEEEYETDISISNLNYVPLEIGATQMWSIYMEKGEGEVLYNKDRTIKYTEIDSYAD